MNRSRAHGNPTDPGQEETAPWPREDNHRHPVSSPRLRAASKPQWARRRDRWGPTCEKAIGLQESQSRRIPKGTPTFENEVEKETGSSLLTPSSLHRQRHTLRSVQ